VDRAWDHKWGVQFVLYAVLESWQSGRTVNSIKPLLDDTGRHRELSTIPGLNYGRRRRLSRRRPCAIKLKMRSHRKCDHPTLQDGRQSDCVSRRAITGFGVGNPYDATVVIPQATYTCVHNSIRAGSEDRVYHSPAANSARAGWDIRLGPASPPGTRSARRAVARQACVYNTAQPQKPWRWTRSPPAYPLFPNDNQSDFRRRWYSSNTPRLPVDGVSLGF